ncbi:MAG: flagellar motor switch protein FliG [Alphaproteobacteria bacterium]|jgi:flagellar motor switch protein FliG|nr:flagellar motor switch protein FliG [Alphaproteobacteria bacterium]MCB1550780.1 flagellar motor switch protein FliG [Alphaproteobacteria bacterium]MCB9984379.1 flagellar motor switch protein FliG [Micavibrio sp.]HPQ50181.1 flagellar motor switch protein FliG [Alphaproteobacteria bacterium]HRK97855.1 flagellar motor switch protein FliG [Alphaproteobacteria bacterium]
MRAKEDYRTLSGVEKAAIFLLSLGEEHTARLFQNMDEEEILEISQTMANLGRVSSSVVERLFMEFAEQMSSSSSLVGTFDSTERLLSKAGLNKDKISSIMEEIRGPAGRTMWEKLGNVNEEVLASFLQKEYPQTVAVVLSKISTEHAARVLALLPEGFALEVIHRMLRMEAIQKDVLDDVEKTLRVEFMANLAKTTRRDSHEMMAEIFNSLDRSIETRIMGSLEETAPDAAEKIRALMFTFEDLGGLDPTSVQTIIRAADKDKLPIALKGATDTLKDLFFSNMSERAAKIMKEDMASMGPVRLKDVEESQQYIVNVAKDLESRGEIILSKGNNDEDSMIY